MKRQSCTHAEAAEAWFVGWLFPVSSLITPDAGHKIVSDCAAKAARRAGKFARVVLRRAIHNE